jgi:hypothetical protein
VPSQVRPPVHPPSAGYRRLAPIGVPSTAGIWMAAFAAAVIAVAAAAARIVVIGHGSLGYLVGAGRVYSDPAHLPPGIPVRSGTGYDGQFMYRLAHDPFDLREQASGVRFDNAFRLGRIGYPILVWLVSAAGRPVLLPAALLLVGVASLATLAALGAAQAQEHGLAAGWGLLVCWPGLLFSIDFDLAEPLEVALVVVGLLALRRRCPGWAAAALAGAVLTRETALIAVLAVVVCRLPSLLRERRARRIDLAWLAPSVAFAGWQLTCLAVTGRLPIASDVGSGVQRPFAGLVAAWPRWVNVADLHPVEAGVHAAELTVLTTVVLAALLAAGTRRPGSTSSGGVVDCRLRVLDPLVVAAAFGAAAACCLSVAVWASRSDLRMFADTYALAALVLLDRHPRLPALTGWAIGVAGLAVAVTIYWAQVA